MTRAAVTVAGGAAALCLGSVPAALAAPAQSTYIVPCNPDALYAAISNASPGDTLDLEPGCTYFLPSSLPEIMHELTIVGYHSTLTRAQDAGSFSLLTVGCGSGDLKVINVNFTDGGGNDGYGGAIENDGGTLHVEGGIFSDNEAGAYGGAIYNDGDMTVSNATFTHNDAEYGGAIYNEDEASVDGSSFTSNGSPYSNYYGGAIYNDDDLDIAYSGFVANSTGDYGGAIYTEYYLDASHITVTANAAGSDGGGGIYNDDETATVSDYSVVVGNRPDNCYDVSGCGF